MTTFKEINKLWTDLFVLCPYYSKKECLFYGQGNEQFCSFNKCPMEIGGFAKMKENVANGLS